MKKGLRLRELEAQVATLNKIVQSNKITLTSAENPEVQAIISLNGTNLTVIKRVTTSDDTTMSTTLLNE